MKIVCDACSAKYSIADEKVQGKVFKIRCKKCSNIIVVRGTGGGAAEEAAAPAAAPAGNFDQKETRVYDYGGYEGGEGQPPAGDEPVWHIVVDQEQVGPLTVPEVQARFAAGDIDGESYIWREGFADWLPLSQVPDFAHLVASGSTTTAQPSSGQDAVASMFGASNYEDAGGTSKSDPNDVFAAHAAKAGTEEDDGAGDLFGQRTAGAKRTSRQTGAQREEAGLFGAGDKPAPAAAGGGGGAGSMRGQRNENSVLFSLGNLAALASDQPRAQAASSGPATPGAAAHGGGEGSGLIDIRSMASAYLGPQKTAGSSGGPRVGSADDLPVFSTAAFNEPAVIIPSLGGARNNNKMLYILLGAVGLLAVVAVVLVVVIMGKDDKPAPQIAANDPDKIAAADPAAKPADPAGAGTGTAAAGAGAGTAVDPAAGAGTGTAAAGATDPAAGAGAGTAAAGAGAGTAVDPAAKPVETPSSGGTARPSSGGTTRPSSGGTTRPSSGGTTRPSSGGTAGTATKPADPPPATGGSCLDELGCLLAEKKPACCAKYGGGKKTGGGATTGGGGGGGGGGGNLPESLTKADISAGIGKVTSKAMACGARSSAKGSVKVSVKVSPAGSVSSVTVKESPDPALGTCVAGAVKGATFAKTQTGGSFSYPFRF